jgi:hypothetical protein
VIKKRTLFLTALPFVALMSAPIAKAGWDADVRVLSPTQNETISSSAFQLDVSYRSRTNAVVTTAELWVDGVRWVRRDLDTPALRGVITFNVDATSLAEGKHLVVIKMFSSDGSVNSATLPVKMSGAAVISNASTNGGPALSFRNLTSGKKVAGTVEIAVDVQSDGIASPFVSFYVDDKFKTLKNFPPYSFLWDTTGVENGLHTIDAVAYLESNNATTKRRMQVYVDNVGGAAKRQNGIPDLNTARAATVQAPTVAIQSPRITIPTTTKLSLSDLTPTLSAVRSVNNLKMVSLGAGKPEAVRPTTVAPKPILSVPAETTKAQSVKSVIDSGIGRMQALPLPGIAGIMKKPAFALTDKKPLAPVKVLPPVRTTRYVPKASTASLLMPTLPEVAPKLQPLQVAFDGMRIAFDVQPRVEKGLPLAPFRHLFEHSGGKVQWVAKTKTVRAANAQREVIIKVGQKNATINGEKVEMERNSFLEKGRTIVPISFVGQALDVNVNYDPVTGRIEITSK